MEYENSCGAVLYRKRNGNYEYLVVKDRNNNWSFAKGHINKGETLGQCAIREIKEEVGIEVKLDKHFYREVSYLLNENTTKCVTYFMADFKNLKPHINDGEIKEIRILKFVDAYSLLTHSQLKNILEDVNEKLTTNINMCCMFSIENPKEAYYFAKRNLDLVESYGTSSSVHTCDEGERWLARCAKCGAYVIRQESETSYTDHLYVDYFPVGSNEHARYVNKKYDGYSIEANYPYKKLFVNDGDAIWR